MDNCAKNHLSALIMYVEDGSPKQFQSVSGLPQIVPGFPPTVPGYPQTVPGYPQIVPGFP